VYSPWWVSSLRECFAWPWDLLVLMFAISKHDSFWSMDGWFFLRALIAHAVLLQKRNISRLEDNN